MVSKVVLFVMCPYLHRNARHESRAIKQRTAGFRKALAHHHASEMYNNVVPAGVVSMGNYDIRTSLGALCPTSRSGSYPDR